MKTFRSITLTELTPDEVRVAKYALQTLNGYVENLSDDQRRCAECGGEDPAAEIHAGTQDPCTCPAGEGLFDWFGDLGEVDVAARTWRVPVGPGTIWGWLAETSGILDHDFTAADADEWRTFAEDEGPKPDVEVGQTLRMKLFAALDAAPKE